MSDGDVTLDEMIDSLLKTPEVLDEVMPKLAAEVKRYLVEANAAGVSPDGKEYQRTKEGHVPLREGAKAISVKVHGTTLYAKVRGVEALHSLGAARGRIKRSMLPEGDAMPPDLAERLKPIVEKHLREVLG